MATPLLKYTRTHFELSRSRCWKKQILGSEQVNCGLAKCDLSSVIYGNWAASTNLLDVFKLSSQINSFRLIPPFKNQVLKKKILPLLSNLSYSSQFKSISNTIWKLDVSLLIAGNLFLK